MTIITSILASSGTLTIESSSPSITSTIVTLVLIVGVLLLACLLAGMVDKNHEALKAKCDYGCDNDEKSDDPPNYFSMMRNLIGNVSDEAVTAYVLGVISRDELIAIINAEMKETLSKLPKSTSNPEGFEELKKTLKERRKLVKSGIMLKC